MTLSRPSIMPSCVQRSIVGIIAVLLVLPLPVTTSPGGLTPVQPDAGSGHHIQRRTVRDTMNFVVDRNWDDGLFYVCDTENPVAEERYAFDEEGLTLDPKSGLVSRNSDFVWPEKEKVGFLVTVTRTDDSSFMDFLTVVVSLVERVYTAPLLSDVLVPLTTTVQRWTSPHTTIITLDALDADDCPVRYQLQSGGDDRFTVDSLTGELQTLGSAPFEPDGLEYTLAVSTMCLGSALRTETPAQTITVQVGWREPQFLVEPYDIWYSEYTEVNTEITTVRAKSFQDLPLRFSWTMTDPDLPETDIISMDPNTGSVTLLRQQVYVSPESMHQIRVNITATEQDSDLTATTMVTFNLQPENAHAPVLPLAMLLQREVYETVSETEDILVVDVTDVDWLDNGTITFTTSDEHFMVENPDGKDGVLRPAMRLDYDYMAGRYYEFTITATDNAPEGFQKSSTTSARIFMLNVNDEAPVLDPPEQVVSVEEGTSAGLLAHVVQAYDPDGDGLEFAFENCDSATKCGLFDIDPRTGEITLNTDVPRKQDKVILEIAITDDSTCCPGAPGNEIHTTRGTVTVEVILVNHPPQFPDCDSYMDARLKEDDPIGTSILSIAAIDTDVGSNGELSYSIVVDNQDQYFAVRDVEGMEGTELISTRVFDRENPLVGGLNVQGDLKYKVTVTATDAGRPNLSTNCFFFVTIEDINDMTPEFDDVSNIAAIPNNLSNGDRVIRIFAVDMDKPGPDNSAVEYSIEAQDSQCPDCFRIEQDSGWILQNTASYPAGVSRVSLEIKASDKGSPTRSATIPSTIHILEPDSTDLPPVWEPYQGVPLDDINDLFIEENSPIGTLLNVDLRASMPNDIAPPVYYVTRGNTPQTNSNQNFKRYSVQSATPLEVGVNALINYESVNEYWIKIRASNEKSGYYTTVRLNVKLIDLNDNSPTFEGLNSNGQYPAAVTEETAPGDYVFSVVAFDVDGTSPNNEVGYRFQALCLDCGAFTMDTVSGQIFAAQTFDRSAKDTYRLGVEVYDGAPGISPPDPNTDGVSSVVVVIGSSLYLPFTENSGQTVDVAEAQDINSTVADITAIDPDAEFNFAQYAIVGGNEDRLFACDMTTGRIYNTRFLFYDDKPEHHVRYRVIDGLESRFYWVNISLVDTNYLPPVFSPLEYEVKHVVEETAIDGGFMVQVTATDPDQSRGGDIRYDLDGALYTSERFQIDVFGNVYVKEALDRDYPFGYDDWLLNVAADDEFGLPDGSSKRGYGILHYELQDINDNAPFFDTSTMVGYVQENSGSGTSVMTVLAYDYDLGENGTVSYSALIVPDDGAGPLFAISSAGVVTTLLANSLDREVADAYYMKIRASDAGNPPKTTDGWLTIHITDDNDHAPEFPVPSYKFTIARDLPRGSSVVALTALDEDLGDNAKLTYAIIDGDSGDNFYMDSIFVAGTGVVKINKVLDDDIEQINFKVRVSDPNFQDTVDVKLMVTNVTNTAPVFVPERIDVTLSKDVTIGTSIATFNATDTDSGLNAQFTYKLDYTNTDPRMRFAVNVMGEVTVRNNLDREEGDVMTVHILAVDEGKPAMTGTGTLVVTVEEGTDNQTTQEAVTNNPDPVSAAQNISAVAIDYLVIITVFCVINSVA